MPGQTLIPVELKKILPTRSGCAVFLGNDEKVILFFVDPFVGSAIAMRLENVSRERPLTHDLMSTILEAVGATLDRVVINDFRDGVYYARLQLKIQNKVQQETLYIEIDARPSDSIALAMTAQCPLLVTHEVWEQAENLSKILAKLESDPGQYVNLFEEDPEDDMEDFDSFGSPLDDDDDDPPPF